MLSGKNLHRLRLPLLQKPKAKRTDSKEKSSPPSLVLPEHDIPTIPCTLCVSSSRRQKSESATRAELLFLPFTNKSWISGRKCLSSIGASCKQQKQETVDAFEAEHPTQPYQGASFYIYGSPKVRKRSSCKFLQYPPVTSLTFYR